MTKVIGVRFRQAGRIYNFAVGDIEVENGQNVIVETARGIEYGEVVGKIKEINEEELSAPLKPIIRVATPEDDEKELENKKKEKIKINHKISFFMFNLTCNWWDMFFCICNICNTRSAKGYKRIN